MGYKKPTKEGIENALADGWERETVERGYDIFNYDGTGLLEINRIDAAYVGFGEDGTTEVSDEDCAIEAERSGFCKIIPINELPENFERKYYGWIDTPDNRRAIQEFCN